MPDRTLRTGTRGSRLALEQAGRVRKLLGGVTELKIIKTSGDRFKDRALHEQDGVGFFTKEIEQELIDDNIDLAVHSLKDLPTEVARGLCVPAMLKRDCPEDVLLVRPDSYARGGALPLNDGAVVGASSLRRQALLKSISPGLMPAPIRGNVPTRVKKLAGGDFDAIVIARAGIERLGLDIEGLMAFDLNPRVWICAPGQGVIAVETRKNDAEAIQRLEKIDHADTRKCVTAERALHVIFGGGCHAPFGAWARITDSGFRISVAAPSESGPYAIRTFESPARDEALRKARTWIEQGMPHKQKEEIPEWIYRPARPWC